MVVKSKTIWGIPARGGSKRIKDKNLQDIGGVSLVGRAIRSAKLAKKIQEVYVSTDSPLISKEARRWGAIAIVRPAELCADDCSGEFTHWNKFGFEMFPRDAYMPFFKTP